MATATTLYDNARRFMLNGTVDVDTDDIRVALLASTYMPLPGTAAWNAATVYATYTVVTVAGKFYEAVVGGTSSGSIPFFSGISGALTTDNTVTWYCWGYAPPSAHSIFANVSANELPTAGGYTAGGVSLTSKALTQVGRGCVFTAAPITWTGATFSARYAVVYKLGTANAVVNPLIAYILLDDLNADVTAPVSAAFTLAWSSAGIFSFK